MTTPALPAHIVAREAASLRAYVKWRAADPRWRAEPYLPATDRQRREQCGAAIAAALLALGGLAGVW